MIIRSPFVSPCHIIACCSRSPLHFIMCSLLFWLFLCLFSTVPTESLIPNNAPRKRLHHHKIQQQQPIHFDTLTTESSSLKKSISRGQCRLYSSTGDSFIDTSFSVDDDQSAAGMTTAKKQASYSLLLSLFIKSLISMIGFIIGDIMAQALFPKVKAPI